MKHLRIGILGTRGIPNRYGGFEQFAERLSAGLTAQGHEVTVYNSTRHSYRSNEWNQVHIVHCYEPGRWLGAASQFVYDLNCMLHARGAGFDVLLVLGYTSSAVWGFLYPARTQVVLNMDGFEWKRSKYNKLVQRFLLFAEALAVKQADHLVADSTVIRSYLEEKYNMRSTFIAYGADTDLPADASVPGSFGLQPDGYYLIIARMVRENNVSEILEGLSAGHQTLPVVVVGDMRTAYGKIIYHQFSKDERFRFIGALFDMHVLHQLRKHCRMYFHGHSVGGTNPSLLEAMAASARICANDNPFNRAVLGNDASYFITAADIDVACNHESVDWHRRLLNNHQKIQERYQWKHIIDQYSTLFTFCCQPVHEEDIICTAQH